MHFNNKVVCAGASSGIGKELAIRLSQQQNILTLTSSDTVEKRIKQCALQVEMIISHFSGQSYFFMRLIDYVIKAQVCQRAVQARLRWMFIKN
jgi:NAD(P)-dependent dehydrogenase (short-subunit alcohol dehydrogenase family)